MSSYTRGLLCLFALWAQMFTLARAEVWEVPPGVDEIPAVLEFANPGDTLQLAEGLHYLTNPVQVLTQIDIVGAPVAPGERPKSEIIIDTNAWSYVFYANNWRVSFRDILIRNDDGSDECKLQEPWGLAANFTIALVQPDVRTNQLNLEADMGPWYNGRYLSDLRFGNCSYLTPGVPFNYILSRFFSLQTKDCHGHAGYRVRFTRIRACGASRTITPEFYTYVNRVEARYVETVYYSQPNKTLTFPATRFANALTTLRAQIRRRGSVTASIVINYTPAQDSIQAVITNVNITKGVNVTDVYLLVAIPSPYSFVGGSQGPMSVNNTAEGGINATVWTTTGSNCNNLAKGQLCNMTFHFKAVGCQLTADYIMTKIPVVCQPSWDTLGLCPSTVNHPFADVRFYLESNDFCKVNEFNISAAFTPDLTLMTDNTFETSRPSNTLVLGEVSYWRIRLWTNETQLIISSAELTGIERTSSGNCSAAPSYVSYLTSIPNDVTYSTRMDLTPPQLHIPLPVTAAMACADSNSTNNNINLTFTVMVDYKDTTTRRRRRREINIKPGSNWRVRRQEPGSMPEDESTMTYDESQDANTDVAKDLREGSRDLYPMAPLQVSGQAGIVNTVGQQMLEEEATASDRMAELGTPTLALLIVCSIFSACWCMSGLCCAGLARRRERRHTNKVAGVEGRNTTSHLLGGNTQLTLPNASMMSFASSQDNISQMGKKGSFTMPTGTIIYNTNNPGPVTRTASGSSEMILGGGPVQRRNSFGSEVLLGGNISGIGSSSMISSEMSNGAGPINRRISQGGSMSSQSQDTFSMVSGGIKATPTYGQGTPGAYGKSSGTPTFGNYAQQMIGVQRGNAMQSSSMDAFGMASSSASNTPTYGNYAQQVIGQRGSMQSSSLDMFGNTSARPLGGASSDVMQTDNSRSNIASGSVDTFQRNRPSVRGTSNLGSGNV